MARTIAILLITIIVLPIVALKLAPVPLDGLQMDMLKTSACIMAIMALTCFALAEITHNCSQVDKI